MSDTFYTEVLAIGGNDGWTLGAGGTKVLAVRGYAAGDDDDTTYLSASSSVYQTFSTDASTLPWFNMTGSYYVHQRSRKVSGTTYDAYAAQRYSGTNQNSVAGGGVGTSYTNFNTAFATAPGGGGWTDAVVKATEIGIYAGFVSASARCTTIFGYFTADYLPGGFVSLLAQLVPGIFSLLGAGVTMAEFMRIIQDPRFSRKSVLSPENLRKHFEDFRNYRFPRSIYLEAR